MKSEYSENSAGKMRAEDLENGTAPDTVDPTTVMDLPESEAEAVGHQSTEVSESGTEDGAPLEDAHASAPVKKSRAPFVVAGLLGALLLGGVAWALCTQPIGMGDGDGSGSMGSSPAAMASDSADLGADDRASVDGEEEKEDEAANQGPETVSADGKQPDDQAAGANKKDSADSSNSNGDTPSKPSKPASSSADSSKPSSGGGSSSASKPSKPAEKPSKPAHQHSWQAVYRTEPVYEQQWVSNWVEEFSYRQGRYVCNGCGSSFTSIAAWEKHSTDKIYAGNYECGSFLDDSYDVYEKVDKGSYQSVQTGTKQVLSHYACSCGATK